MLHRAAVVVPIGAEPIRDGAVDVVGDRVVWVGPAAEYRGGTKDVRDWPGVLTPGLVNAHTHLQYTDFGDCAAGGMPFHEWIGMLIARRRGFTEEMWRDGVRRGIDAMLRTGTTCVADVVSEPYVLEPLAGSGLAGTAYVEVGGVDQRLWDDGRRVRYRSVLDNAPRGLRLGVAPHTPYTLGEGVIRDCVATGRARGLRVHPHLAESAAEVEFVLAGTGPFQEMMERVGLMLELSGNGSGTSPARYLDSLGALGPDVHVAHGVHLDAADRDLLRRHGTAVALCARSNAILMSGDPPVAALRAEGSPIAVGTDSLASCPSLDLLDELAALRDLALRQGSPGAGLDRWLVEAATAGGASALGLTGEVGVLRPGVRADFAVFDVPTDGDPYEALVRSGGGRCAGTVLAGVIRHG